MKEFEKWYNQTIRPYIHNPKDKDIAKVGWRVALEWIYKEARKLEKQPECPIDAFDLIEEELGNVERTENETSQESL